MTKISIEIEAGRHPVVEQVMTDPFIANPITLHRNRRMLIITGPNMGGKSTYMRQTALIVLLAHIGAFVPPTAPASAPSTASSPASGHRMISPPADPPLWWR